jgi:hypothetical protein
MRNIGDVTGEPLACLIVVYLRCEWCSLVAFYDMVERERCYSFVFFLVWYPGQNKGIHTSKIFL